MISINKEYKPLNIKSGITKKGQKYSTFGLSNGYFNNETQKWENGGFINVFTITDDIIGNKIKIKEITGIDMKEFNGKTQTTVFAIVENTEDSTLATVSGDDLPF